MFVRRLLSPPVIVGASLIVAVAIVGGFITNPLPIDTAVWSDFIESRSPALNTFMTADLAVRPQARRRAGIPRRGRRLVVH